ncbi:cache domain-containing protein [Trinickia caryophylli]|uniref:Two-component system, NarL family, sensor kinase n=1 Tax=Trinickia caryophylli TaxID=28094 RepID=A0A1X7G453_TRICW|nr:cache domain-containing protein [Trinickia caryophylli]PMS13767.1 histidine kinase [Trinickia caryophylli]TRX14266.1 histidine kinase [Trinickia caryophylli]WQE14097.1 cache domain-containing protein [Trinickia caryophylli]SMF63621.1 two-component system, NarL family, sensor kinase [Trinickia caryophylli]GLU33409.1 sensor kinase [Trinickia caryophylli]
MKVKTKIFLLAIVPFLVAIAGIGIGVRMQATSLAKAQHATVETAYMSSKQMELKHYVELATSAIAPFYGASADSPQDDATLRRKALEVLQKMDFGQDGYFFVYDMQGNSLMHPREPGLVGRNLWEMRDPQGALPIQELIAAAARGGDYVRYTWHRPSTGQVEAKLGYVVPLPRWGWMLGTGIYLDGVNAALARIDESASANIGRTMMWIGAIALEGFVVIAACAVFVNVTEHRSADAKLKRLAQQVVESQEQERARISRELHDGISQKMVSVKLLFESALARLESASEQARVPSAEAALSTGLVRLSDALREVRRISHALRPAMLDDLGLAAALEQLCREVGEEAGIDIAFTRNTSANAPVLSDAINTAFFRIAQEALANILRHAHAKHAALTIDADEHAVSLTIIDDGIGFDIEQAQADARGGIGLRNMRERLDALGGNLSLASTAGRTVVIARVPLSRANARPTPLPTPENTTS